MSQSVQDFVSPLKVTALKDKLKKRGLSTYGNKAALQQRLIESLQSDEDGDNTADTTAETEGEQPDQSGFNLTLSDNPAEEEENTDESVIEAEQNESASKDEQPMEQSDDVGDSSASKGEAPDSTTEEQQKDQQHYHNQEQTKQIEELNKQIIKQNDQITQQHLQLEQLNIIINVLLNNNGKVAGDEVSAEEVDGDNADNKDEEIPESTSKESEGQTMDLTTEKSAEQVNLANGDDKADSKAENDEAKTDEAKTDEDKTDEDKTDEAKIDEAKTDEGKPEESDSTASKKRPREDEEAEQQDQKETPKKQSAKDTPYEIIDEYMAEDDYQPPDDDSIIVLDRYHSDLYFNIQKDGLGGYGRTEKGFAYLWAGCRATWGCKDGRYCYECKIGEYMDVDLPASEEHPHVVRVGFSTESSTMNLGEVAQSYGYGASGQSSTAGMFNSYGESFGPGDIVGCFVDLHSDEQSIAFSKNGKHFGKCFVLSPDFRGKVLFPHITTKNVRVTVNFGNEPLVYEIPDDYQPLQKADTEHLVRASKGPTKKEDCEVIMMVGLPAAGKTKWAEKYCQDKPDMNVNILGTNFIMDKMKVSGLQRKRNYHGRWEQLIKQATQILNRLFILASRQPRNYIIDQTNVYKNAQARKIRHFEGFKCKAVVICPTEEERKKRDSNRQREEGIFIPEEAVYEMKVNFSLPNAGDLFEEVMYVEQSEEEIREQIEKYHVEKRPASSSSHSKRPRYEHSSGGSRGYDSRPPPRSSYPPRGGSSYSPRGGSSYPSRSGPSYHQGHGSSPYQSQGGPPYRGSASGGYRDSYGYRDHPPPPPSRDFGHHYDHPPPMRSGGGGGYGPPYPRSGMDSAPAHYYDRYGPPPPPHRYDRGPPPPPHGYPPHHHPPPPQGGGGGYYGGGGHGSYRGGPPPPPSHYYSQRRY